MIEIKPMGEAYIHIGCLHNGPVDPGLSPIQIDDGWFEAPDLPTHPWSDETITTLAKKYGRISEGWAGEPCREFMREMIQRYGTCAILAWDEGKVVGHLRFYPLGIAQHLVAADQQKQHLLVGNGATLFEPDPKALWVQCVMTARPYVGSHPHTTTGHSFPSMADAGARKGIGSKLVLGLIDWTREHGWKKIVKLAHSDIDCLYGQHGGGGKAFWEKAGFTSIKSHHLACEEWMSGAVELAEKQGREKGMTPEEVWTWYRMVYELPQ